MPHGKKVQISNAKSKNDYKILSVAIWYFLVLIKLSLPQAQGSLVPADLGQSVVISEPSC